MAVQAVMLERRPAPAYELSISRATIGRARVELGGVFIDNVDLDTATSRIERLLHSGRAHQVVTVNLDFLSIANRDARFRETLNASDLAVADGMPLVWLSRLQGEPLSERVTGVSLVDECCRLAARARRSVFLLGAAPGVAAAAGKELQRRNPGLEIAGTYSPALGSLTHAENERIVAMIRAARPGFLFVALGAPRQDLWIRENLESIDVPVSMGVGCVFDILAGNVDRAPGWMQKSGLEWAYRLVHEPSRLWRRYLVNDLGTLARLLVDVARKGGAPTGDGLVVPT